MPGIILYMSDVMPMCVGECPIGQRLVGPATHDDPVALGDLFKCSGRFGQVIERHRCSPMAFCFDSARSVDGCVWIMLIWQPLLDMGMGLACQFEILEAEAKDILHVGVDHHLRVTDRGSGSVAVSLLQVVAVYVGITEGMTKSPSCQSGTCAIISTAVRRRRC